MQPSKAPLPSLPKALLKKDCRLKLASIEDYRRKLNYITDQQIKNLRVVFYAIKIFNQPATRELLPILFPTSVLIFSHVIY